MNHLPAELISRIHGLLDPLSTFHLALVNRQLASHSRDALKLNGRRAEIYETVSDQDKDLVRTICSDAGAAWHVKYLEIWDVRDATGDFQDFMADKGDAAGDLQDFMADKGDADLTLMPAGYREYGSEDLQSRIRWITGVDVVLDLGYIMEWRDALQTLLLLRCPRIQMLKGFRPRLSGVDERPWARADSDLGPNAPHAVSSLCAVIDSIWSMPQPVWPNSLTSLRQLAIGLPFQDQRGRAILRSRYVLPLFLLPCLETVYIRGLAVTNAETEDKCNPDDFAILDNASSSVRHVCLGAVIGDDTEFAICNIIRACRHLETLILASCECPAHFDWVPTELAQRQAGKIKTFFPCGNVSRLRGDSSAVYGEMWSALKSLRVLPIELDEIASRVRRSQANDSESDDSQSEDSRSDDSQFDGSQSDDKGLPNRAAFLRTFEEMRLGFPDACEVLVLHARNDHVLGPIDEGLAILITPADEDEGSSKLKAIYLDKAVDRHWRRSGVDERESVFPKLEAAAARLGIRVYREKGALNRFAEEMCRDIFGVSLALDKLRR